MHQYTAALAGTDPDLVLQFTGLGYQRISNLTILAQLTMWLY